MAFRVEGNRLIYLNDSEILQLEPWGANSLRVRGTKTPAVSQESWALLDPAPCEAEIKVEGKEASIRNGKLLAKVNRFGWLTYYNGKGHVLLEERWRVNDGGEKTSPLAVRGREYKPIIGSSDYKITLRFEAATAKKSSASASGRSGSSTSRAAPWSSPSATRSPASRSRCPASATAFCGTTPPWGTSPSPTT
jgi:alpha-D-xyloside xylohydrolase